MKRLGNLGPTEKNLTKFGFRFRNGVPPPVATSSDGSGAPKPRGTRARGPRGPNATQRFRVHSGPGAVSAPSLDQSRKILPLHPLRNPRHGATQTHRHDPRMATVGPKNSNRFQRSLRTTCVPHQIRKNPPAACCAQQRRQTPTTIVLKNC